MNALQALSPVSGLQRVWPHVLRALLCSWHLVCLFAGLRDLQEHLWKVDPFCAVLLVELFRAFHVLVVLHVIALELLGALSCMTLQ